MVGSLERRGELEGAFELELADWPSLRCMESLSIWRRELLVVQESGVKGKVERCYVVDST